MPLYFFHLNFGERVWPDEEGVELRDRLAARNEALAVIRDLTRAEKNNPRRWASWFLQIADDQGPFVRLPIGYPALDVVAKNGVLLRPEEAEVGQMPSSHRPSRPTRIPPPPH